MQNLSVKLFKVLSFSATLLLSCIHGNSQCTATTLFPSSPVNASFYNDTVVVSTLNRPGHYFQVKNLSLNKSYVFTSSNAGDYITIRNVNTNAVLGHGPVPYTYNVGSGPDLVNVHLNLAIACGTETAFRTTKLVCSNCPAPPGKTGVNNSNPQATLDVAGEIKLGNNKNTEQEGMIRWNATTKDFEGYNGTSWISLTKSNADNGNWGQVSSANIQENTKLIASDGAAGDYFGWSVSISNDYAIIGAYGDDIGSATNQGSAYIYVRNGTSWTQQAKLIASDGLANDMFGSSVAIDGDYAIVGAYGDDVSVNTGQGSAYIYVRNGANWIQEAKLTASDGSVNDQFGISVAIDGDYAIVGAYLDDVSANTGQGSAYVFIRSGSSWTQQAKLTASDGSADDSFGYSVSISGAYAIVGAYLDDVGANTGQGSAYVFIRSGSSWIQQAKLNAIGGGGGDYFGRSVSIDDNYAIIGAMFTQLGGVTEVGAAYIFVRSGTSWAQQATLVASDRQAGDRFGASVSIRGIYAIVSLPFSSSCFDCRGSAYIFERSGTSWIQQAKLNPSDGIDGTGLEPPSFGYSVSISDEYAIVGAYGRDGVLKADQGAAYIIKKN
jgi:hypothetical protein